MLSELGCVQMTSSSNIRSPCVQTNSVACRSPLILPPVPSVISGPLPLAPSPPQSGGEGRGEVAPSNRTKHFSLPTTILILPSAPLKFSIAHCSQPSPPRQSTFPPQTSFPPPPPAHPPIPA